MVLDISVLVAVGGNVMIGAFVWYKLGKCEAYSKTHSERLDRIEKCLNGSLFKGDKK